MADSQCKSGKPSALSVCRVYKKQSITRGHHIYQKSWTLVIGEVLTVKKEENSQHDDYAVVVMTATCCVSIQEFLGFFFLKCGGVIRCQICSKRKHGVGLEVPCVYLLRENSF